MFKHLSDIRFYSFFSNTISKIITPLLLVLIFGYTSGVFATILTPVDKFNHVKVVGHWHQYNVYDVDASDLSLDIPPFVINSIAFQTDLELADALTPIDAADINKNGVKCQFLCVNPANQVIGYNPVLYAQEKARLKATKKK